MLVRFGLHHLLLWESCDQVTLKAQRETAPNGRALFGFGLKRSLVSAMHEMNTQRYHLEPS